MKPTIQLLAFAAAASGMAFGAAVTAYTTPVGYVTETLTPGMYNLAGLTLQQPAVAAGVFTDKAGTTLTVGAIDFTTGTTPLLTPGKTYILELPDGTVQEVTTWDQHTLTTPEDISGLITVDQPAPADPVVVGTKFILRPAATVSDIFGAQNTAGLKSSPDGDLTNCDVILVPTGGLLLGIYFFDDGFGTTGWYTDNNDPAENIVISYPDGFYVQRAPGASDISLTITGEVKKTPTGTILTADYNYLGGVAPVGLTLATSGISDYISNSPDGDPATVDNVMLAKVGGYTTCYYFNDGLGTTGWYTDNNDPADDLPITSGIVILNRGVAKPLKISVPSSYPSL